MLPSARRQSAQAAPRTGLSQALFQYKPAGLVKPHRVQFEAKKLSARQRPLPCNIYPRGIPPAVHSYRER